MPLYSQFALSLEVTRLVPFNLITSKITEKILQFARDLQNSGSDILIEEDLLSIFGRCRVAPQMERSFRTLVLKQSSVPLSDGLSLENGAGPTVLRRLTEPRYFATVLQCSMLTW